MEKNFKLRREHIAPIATGRGGCVATDRIVVDGAPVGYMYREAPVDPRDSGWRFLAGDEDEAYMANNDHHGVYDVNTIVNYDPAVISLLDADLGSRFERGADNLFRKLDPEE